MPSHRHPQSVSGIYAIICRVNGKKYYGSSYNCRGRKSHHWSDLRNGRHRNIHLQRAWGKHGEAAFDFVVVREVPVDRLLEFENRYLPLGDYNILKDAERPTNTAPIGRICRHCRKRFLAKPCDKKNGRRKFCSMKCYRADHRGETEDRVCGRCGKVFACYSHRAKDGRGNYCSRECYTPPRPPKACAGCGQAFDGDRSRKYCSQACYWKAKTVVAKRPCRQCGLDFLPNSHSRHLKFCSRACYYENLKRNKQESPP